MRKSLLLLIPFLAIICGCTKNRDMVAFSTGEEIRLQVGGAEQFVYDPLTCQLGFSRDRKQFRAHTDDMSDYFIVDFSEIPVSEGQVLTADITWTTANNVLSRKNLTLELIRLEGDKVWLWSYSGHIGLTIRILE